MTPAKTTSKRCKDCKVRCRSAFRRVLGEDSRELDSIRKNLHFSAGKAVPLTMGRDGGFLCIRQGHVLVEVSFPGKKGPLTIWGPGDLVGFACDKTELRQSVRALENGSACFFSWSAFQRLQSRSTGLSRGVIEKLCEVMVTKDKRISALENASVKARVASFLLSFERKFGEASEHGSRIDLKLDRRAFARIAGTVTETLSRTLADLEKDQAILREGWDIHVLNPKLLQRIAQS